MFHFTGVRTVRTGDPMLRYAHEELTIYFLFKTQEASSSFEINHPPQNEISFLHMPHPLFTSISSSPGQIFSILSLKGIFFN